MLPATAVLPQATYGTSVDFGGPRVDAVFEKAYSFANSPMNGDEVGWADRAARPAVVTGPSNTLPADLAQDR